MTNANNSNKIIDTKKALVKQFDALLTKYKSPNKENEFLNKMNEFDFDMLNYCYGFSCFSITLITNCYNYL